jgi:hypothetical protein
MVRMDAHIPKKLRMERVESVIEELGLTRGEIYYVHLIPDKESC